MINTDESHLYNELDFYYGGHDTVNHSKEEYNRTDERTGRRASTNRVEGFFSGMKRTLDGTHHHVGHDYLPFYVGELVFKYNERDVSDGARTVAALTQTEGKRLSLRPMKSLPTNGGERA